MQTLKHSASLLVVGLLLLCGLRVSASTVTATIPSTSSSSDKIRVDGLYNLTAYPASPPTRNYIDNKAQGRGVYFNFQGASVSMGVYSDSTDGFTLTVDGVDAVSSIAGGNLNAWSTYTFSGYADDGTVHVAKLTVKVGGFKFLDCGTGTLAIPFTVTSALTASISAPTGHGTKIVGYPGVSLFQIVNGSSGGNMVVDGITNVDTANANLLMSPIKGIRFKSSTSFVKIMCLSTATGQYSLYQDGTLIADNVTTGASGYNIISIATGLSGTHEYQLLCHIGDGQYLQYIEIDDGSLVTQSHTPYPNEVWDGDSIVAGLGLATGDKRKLDSYIVSRALGHWPIVHGSSGANVSTYLRDHVTELNAAAMPSLVAPVRIWLEGGTNDCFNGVSTATFQADYQTYVTNYQTLFPGVPIICRKIFDTSRSTTTQLNIYRALQAAAVSSLSGVTVVSTTGWWDYTNVAQSADALHPNELGYATIAPHEIALFSTAPKFRRGGNRSGSRSVASVTSLISPRILEQLGCADIVEDIFACAH